MEWWETSHQLHSWGWNGGRRLTSSVVGGGVVGDVSPAPQLGVEWWETSHQLRSWGWSGGRRLTSSVVGGGVVGDVSPAPQLGVEWWETSHQLRSWGWRGGSQSPTDAAGIFWQHLTTSGQRFCVCHSATDCISTQ